MLALAGLLGLLMTGMVVDVPGLFGNGGQESVDEAPDGADTSTQDDAAGVWDDLLTSPGDQQPPGGNNDAPDGTVQSGSEDDDTLIGTSGVDQIHGAAGDDLIEGGGEDDHLFGGTGADTISGGDGNDTIHGNEGDDHMLGDAGNDKIFGHGENDQIEGGAGDDHIWAGQGDDFVDGGKGSDSLEGGYGNDTLIGGAGQDTMMGGEGNDILYGHAPMGEDDATTDFLNGNDGNDHLVLGQGDHGYGGEGADTFELSDQLADGPGAQIGDFNQNEDQIVISVDGQSLQDNVVTIETDTSSGHVNVLLNGIPIAHVANAAGLTADMVTLVSR